MAEVELLLLCRGDQAEELLVERAQSQHLQGVFACGKHSRFQFCNVSLHVQAEITCTTFPGLNYSFAGCSTVSMYRSLKPFNKMFLHTMYRHATIIKALTNAVYGTTLYKCHNATGSEIKSNSK